MGYDRVCGKSLTKEWLYERVQASVGPWKMRIVVESNQGSGHGDIRPLVGGKSDLEGKHLKVGTLGMAMASRARMYI